MAGLFVYKMLDVGLRHAYTSSAFMAENDMRAYYVFAMRAMADITGTILVPAVLAVLLRAVYKNLAYEQLIFFISLIVVLILSLVMVVKKIQRYGTEYKKLTDTKPVVPGSGSGS